MRHASSRVANRLSRHSGTYVPEHRRSASRMSRAGNVVRYWSRRGREGRCREVLHIGRRRIAGPLVKKKILYFNFD